MSNRTGGAVRTTAATAALACYGLPMAATMTMNRVIHEAVRRDLDRLHTALFSVRAGDAPRARQLERAYANLHRELVHHHEGEDALVFPYVASVGGGPVVTSLLETMEGEHQAMAAALAETSELMAAYASSASASNAESARASVARTRAVVDRHLDHEEQEFEPLLLPHAQTPEWKAVEKRLRPKSLAVTGRFLAWIQDGMSPEARTYLDATIPRPVTLLVARLAGRAYSREVAPVWRAESVADGAAGR